MRRLRSQSGFTMVEVLIASAIAVILALGLAGMYLQLSMTAERMAEDLERASGELVGTRQIWIDVRDAGLSLNTLTVEADAPAGANFFDTLPDVLCTGGAAGCRRTFTLDFAGAALDPPKAIPLLLQAKMVLAPSTPIRPPLVYDFGNVPPLPNATVNGTVAFSEAKFKTVITGLDPNNGTALAWWKDGRVLQLYSPVQMRPNPGLAIANMQVPPRVVSFVGQINGNRLERVPAAELPVTGTSPLNGQPITNVDEFFRNLPPVGGANAFAMIRPAMIVRYKLERVCMNGFYTGQLVREVYDSAAGGFGSCRVVTRGVSRLVFSRATIDEPAIETDLFMDFDPRTRQIASGGGRQTRPCPATLPPACGS